MNKRTAKWGGIILVLGSVYLWGIPTSCVQLPNGLKIGKQALLDLSRPYFLPDIVPKFANGRSLLPGDAWPFFATVTTVHGRAMLEDHRQDFRFAWRKDTGLVLKREEPERYEILVSQAGTNIGETTSTIVDSHIVMMALQERPEYAGQTCRTRWVTW